MWTIIRTRSGACFDSVAAAAAAAAKFTVIDLSMRIDLRVTSPTMTSRDR